MMGKSDNEGSSYGGYGSRENSLEEGMRKERRTSVVEIEEEG